MPSTRNLPLNFRLLGMVGILVVGFLGLIVGLLQAEKNRAVDARVDLLRALVQTARGVATNLQKQEAAGSMTHDAALTSFRNVIRTMRYGNADYLFVYDNSGTVLVLPPSPNLEGQNRIDLKDPSGRSVIRELIAKAADGGGVVESSYPRPGTTLPVPKMNYVEPFEPWNIIIATGVFVDDLATQTRSLLIQTVLAAAAVTSIASVLAWLLARSVSGPLGRLAVAMTSIANGDLSAPVPTSDRGDEIGRMTRTVTIFKANAMEKQALEAARALASQEARAAQQRTAGAVADRLEAQLGQVAGSLHTASERLTSTANQMRHATDAAETEASSAKALVEGTTSNVGMVATAAEQLAGSVYEISRQVTQSSMIAVRAVEEAKRTNGLVQTLSDAANKIGNIVQVINGIAGQTNLLALNATIEAARAGEAGKGFAVVAGEVKNLASQTAKATDEVAAQIGHIQAVTIDAVAAIGNISATINEISQLSGGIAAAVEEQGAATQEIGRNVREAATGTMEVSNRIGGTSRAVSLAGGSAEQVQSAAEGLAEQSRALTAQLGRLVDEVRAA